MAKVKITFDLDNENDLYKFDLLHKSEKMAIALFEISRNLKKNTKTYKDVFENIAEILEDNNLKF